MIKCGYKGCQKKVILLKNTGSDFFEEAYFVISEKTVSAASEKSCSDCDMIAEASKIIANNRILYADDGDDISKERRERWKWYLRGLLSGLLGMAAAAAVYLAVI